MRLAVVGASGRMGRAVVRLNPDGPCDHRVKVLRFDDGNSLEPMAILMHAACHPCVFTWGDRLTPPYPNGFPKISADFPGEAQTFVESVYSGKTAALFLQGCAGDVRPNLPGEPYRCGDEADIKWTGRGLGTAVVKAADRALYAAKANGRNQVMEYLPHLDDLQRLHTDVVAELPIVQEPPSNAAR